MKKCDVCASNYSDSQGICPICGYEPTDLYVGGAGEWQDEAGAYRDRLLQTISVEMTCYAHTADGDTLRAEERALPLLAKGELKHDGQTHWSAQRFCAAPDTESLAVSLRVLQNGRVRTSRRVLVRPPREHALLQVGLSLAPNSLNASLHLKNDTTDAASEPFHLLAE